MMWKRTGRTRLGIGTAAAGIALALALSGCESAVDQQDPGGSGNSDTPTEGGVLTIASASDAQPNFILAGRQGNAGWASNVFETLTTYDENREPQPRLATDWTLAEDGLSLQITLRDDVTFHSGRATTAEDVQYSIEAAADEESGSQVGFIAQSFESIDVTSDTEITIHLSQPTPNIFDFFEQTFIVDSETFNGLADGSEVIGTGPFLFESWSPGSEITLTRNDDYWGGAPLLDGIEIAVINDSTAMLNAVRSNRSAVAIGMSPVDIQSLSTNPEFTIVNTSGAVYPLGLNITTEPFDARAVRQAVNYAIDRERIADQVFGDAGIVTDLFWAPDTPGYPTDLATHYTYDPDRAREMITEAGADGADVELTVIGLPDNRSVAEIVRNNLAEVGLNATVNAIETTSFGPRQLEGDLGQAFMPLHGLNGLGPATLIDRIPSIREANSSQFWPDEYVELREELLQAATPEEQEQALRTLSEYMLEEAFATAIVQTPGQRVVANTVHDLGQNALGYLDARTAYLTD